MIPAHTPLLPDGVRVWGVQDWPTWSFERFSEQVGNLYEEWEKIDAPARQDRLWPLAQNAAILLRLTGRATHSVCLNSESLQEGFQWVLDDSPQRLPWLWGNKPSPSPLDFLDSPPLSLPELWRALLKVELPADPTGAVASLVWFSYMAALFSWWDCRLTGRLSSGLLFNEVSVDGVVFCDVVGTGRRFGPSLSAV